MAHLSALPSAAEAVRIVAGLRLGVGIGIAGALLGRVAVVIGRVQAVRAAGQKPTEKLQDEIRADDLAQNPAVPRATIRPLVLRVGVGLVAGLPRLIGVGIAVIVLVLTVLIAILRRPEAERVIILLVLLLIAGWNNTAYYPSNIDLQSSLTLAKSYRILLIRYSA